MSGPQLPASTRIAQGYATQAPTIGVGSVVVAGQVDPAAQVQIPLAMFNRHGLVAGATGTGKTKTLQVLAEQLSDAGVPVLIPDIKGDLSGLSTPGEVSDRVTTRATETGIAWSPAAYPVEYLALAGQGTGIPLRATIDSFGPLLLSKVLELNNTQESTLGLIFHWADTQGLPLLDIKDLRSVVTHLTSDEGKGDLKGLGGVSKATAGVILRAVTNLEAQGGDVFFGEPQLDVADLMRVAPDGRGVISLLGVAELQTRPVLYSTFLMWLLAELFEELPEVGDIDKPKLVFLFDEAHLLFTDASKAFLTAVQQTVKLIRSKGVGVFFCTQQPTDVPSGVLSQLGARIQHALRAFTPDDQKALAATVRTYPVTDDYDLSTALTSLGTGEAIVTVLSEKGAPTPVAWTRVRPPRSLMAPADPELVAAGLEQSPLRPKYEVAVDRESAYEMLTARLSGAVNGGPVPTGPVPTGPTGYVPTGPVSTGPVPTGPVPTGTAPRIPAPPVGLPPVGLPPVSTAPDLNWRPAPTWEEIPPAAPSGGGDLWNSGAIGGFMKSFGSALGSALGRSMSGTRRRRR